MNAAINVLTVMDREVARAGGASYQDGRELIEARVAVVELIEASAALSVRLCLHGAWEEGCFYYNGYSAPELMDPMANVAAALRRVKGERA
jgi:hypothetical protein